MEKIIYEEKKEISILTLNHPEKRNAFDIEMSQYVMQQLKIAAQKGQRVVIITSNPAHGVFSSGHDLNQLTSVKELGNDPMFEMFDCIRHLPIPVIAQVNGAVYAGALHLLMVCDLVYATQTSTVVMTANKMGLPFSPSHYLTWLSVMGIHHLKALFYTASPMSAHHAFHAGIFNEVLTSEKELQEKVTAVCEQILACSTEGIANTKLQLDLLTSSVNLSKENLKIIETARDEILKSPTFHQRVRQLIAKTHHRE